MRRQANRNLGQST